MKMSKRNESLDRLSELPDSLVLNILSLLPTRAVVKTTLLSKRFKDLWTTVPCLNFKSRYTDTSDSDEELDENCIIKYHNTRFQNFVNRALMLWRGTKILEFKVVMFYYERPPFSDLDVWLRFAVEYEVEKLYVNLLTEWEHQYLEFTEYCPPQCLYSCSSIRELHLECCKLKINGNVQWDQLKYLKFYGFSLSEHVMNQILSFSPQLEVLSLSLVEVYEGLTIRSSSLKVLKIMKFNYERVRSVLTIWAPNLETLKISGNPHSKYVMKNVSSLTNATVDVDIRVYVNDGDGDGGGGGGGNMKILFEDIIGKAYETNRHVERVTLSTWCIKMLGEMRMQEKLMFEKLSNAKFLNLYDCQVDELKSLLEIFPKLTKLVLKNRQGSLLNPVFYQISWSTKDPSIPKLDTDSSFKSRNISLESCLLHLTTVEIEWTPRKDSLFQIVKFLLKNASKLERLVIQVKNSKDYELEYWVLVAEKLLKIPRSSPAAVVILCRE